MKKILLYMLFSFLLIANVFAVDSLSLPAELVLDGNTGQTITKSFEILNNGDTVLAEILLSTADTPLNYNVVLSQYNIATLAKTDKVTIDVTLDIPADETSGKKSIGTITITSGTFSGNFPLKVDVEGRLIIGDLDIKIDNKDEVTNLKDGDEVREKLKPGSRIEVSVKIDNKFSDAEDIEIENIEVIVILSEIDDGEDLEEETDEFDLNADEDARRLFKFRIPYEVEEGDYLLDINVEGEGEDGKTYTADWTLIVEVDKDSHRLKILKSEVIPKIVKAGSSTKLSVEIYNLGGNEEDEVRITAKNSDLQLDFVDYNIELENDLLEDESKYIKTIAFVVPSGLSSGTYTIEVMAYYDDDNLDDFMKVNVIVEGKEETGEGEGETSEGEGETGEGECETSEGEGETGEGEGETTITETVESETPSFVIPLLIVNGFLIIGVIILIVILVKRK